MEVLRLYLPPIISLLVIGLLVFVHLLYTIDGYVYLAIVLLYIFRVSHDSSGTYSLKVVLKFYLLVRLALSGYGGAMWIWNLGLALFDTHC